MKQLNFRCQLFQERLSKNEYLSVLQSYLEKSDWQKLCMLLAEHCDPDSLLAADVNVIMDEVTFYIHLLETSWKEISKTYFADFHDCVAVTMHSLHSEILKTIRIYVLNLDVVQSLIETSAFYDTFDNLLNLALCDDNGKAVHVRYLLQTLINMVTVGTDSTRLNIIKKLRRRFLWCIEQYFKKDLGHQYECSALIYNLWLPFEINNVDLICSIVQQHERQTYGDYTGFLVEKIIFERFIWLPQSEIPADIRISFMSYLIEFFFDCPNKSKISILPEQCIQYLINHFLAVNCTIEHLTGYNTLKQQIQQICQVIQLIAIITSDDKENIIKNNENVFKRTAAFLININESDDILLSLLEVPEHDLIPFVEVKPRFSRFTAGVKCDLVRIIGNMCWKNKTMQDLARTTEAIFAVLDSLKIDDKHPFIPQWSIFAIRNFCENNEENQKIISQLSQQEPSSELSKIISG